MSQNKIETKMARAIKLMLETGKFYSSSALKAALGENTELNSTLASIRHNERYITEEDRSTGVLRVKLLGFKNIEPKQRTRQHKRGDAVIVNNPLAILASRVSGGAK